MSQGKPETYIFFYKKENKMSIGLKFQNLDDYYSSTSNQIVINDLDYSNSHVREAIVDRIRTIHDSETLSMVAKCACEAVSGNFRIGETCSKCGTDVELDKGRYEPGLWCRKLTDVKWLSPKFWMLFNSIISNTVDALLYLMDKNYRCRAKIDPALEKIVEMEGYERSYSFVINNMELILTILSETLPSKKREAMGELKVIYERDKELLYSDHLAMLSKKLFVTELTGTCKFTQKAIATPINNVMRFMKASHNLLLNKQEQELIMAETIASLVSSVNTFYKTSMAGKFGGSRLNYHAMKAPFSGRCVGTSITRAHDIRSVEIPWSAGIVMFRAQIVGQLIRNYRFSLKDAKKLINLSHQKYNKTIDIIMQNIIKSSPYEEGYPIMMVRNPTLLPSSMLWLGISRVKTNVVDTTVSISVLLMTLFAGDFDGDEYSFGSLIDKYTADGFRYLEPASSALSYDKVAEVNEVMGITKATCTILANAINKTRNEEPIIIKNNIFELQ
jgi:hypothetical protein